MLMNHLLALKTTTLANVSVHAQTVFMYYKMKESIPNGKQNAFRRPLCFNLVTDFPTPLEL